MVDRITGVLERADDLAIQILIILDDEKTHRLPSSLLHLGHFAGGSIDYHMDHPAVLLQHADNVNESLAVAAQGGAQQIAPRNGPPRRPDGDSRRNNPIPGCDLSHLLGRQAGLRHDRTLGPRGAKKPHQGDADPQGAHDWTLALLE